MKRNIEFKARYTDLEAARNLLSELGAQRTAEVRQVDTYFQVANGRLKLRVSSDGVAQLIFYRRQNQISPRPSDYISTPVVDAVSLSQALAGALGIAVEVGKTREVYRLDSVRIHLDVVDGLGSFIEFEAEVDEENDDAQQMERVKRLQERFGILDSARVAGSYADLHRSSAVSSR